MKNRTATPPDELISALQPPASRHEGNGNGAETAEHICPSLLRLPKRTISFALALAVVLSSVLLLLGYNALAKGLLLGTLFSCLNFFLMAIFLPLLVGQTRSRSSIISLASVCLRFALLAVPLVVAAKHGQFAIASTIVGVFMIQIVILVDHSWFKPQNQSGE